MLEDEVRGCLIQDGSIAGGGNLAGDPGFVDAAGRDFRLAADSPCVDKGMVGDGASGASDLDGRPRRNGAPDLGAYER